MSTRSSDRATSSSSSPSAVSSASSISTNFRVRPRRCWSPMTSADPGLVAADLLAQAEHDPMASAILITNSPMLAHAVLEELPLQLASLERADIAGQSLAANGLVVLVPDVATAIDLANCYAPEHLCLLLHDPWSCLAMVRHAGGIFVGEDSPEALGDYTAGPSHVMPTGGTARFSSPINVAEFTKVISVIAANTTCDAPPRSGDLDTRSRRRAHRPCTRHRAPPGTPRARSERSLGLGQFT